MKILNITNGTNTVDLMQAAEISGDKLSWDDLLHEGPVPADLSLDELSVIRADYIIAQGWASAEQVKDKFETRNKLIKRHLEYDKIILWFEHDLYDQLQLIQILDWFNQQSTVQAELMLVCVDKHLGNHTPEEFALLVSQIQKVMPQQIETATQAWQAFTSPDAKSLENFVESDLSQLPFLKSALLRLLKERPTVGGLPQTERLILQSLQTEPLAPGKLFVKYQKLEQAEFMGDSTFWSRLNQMAFCEYPLVEYQVKEKVGYPFNPEQKVKITDYGQQAIVGEVDWFRDNKMEKYVGGVPLKKS